MESPIVATNLGQVKGLVLPKANHEDAKQVFAYLGIPFAKPPLGKLRFMAPEKAEPWQGVLDASKNPPLPMATNAAAQLLAHFPLPLLPSDDLERMSEDCLYLNVYTNNPNKAANLPVLFWIFGGAFNTGSAIGYNGQALCGLNDVVLVVPQYRVNVFGFYSLGQETSCKGNMGLRDQIMAMKWVNENILNFGGNPDNVTIFGESSGAISVSYHVMSPESRGLFHRAISQSGSATVPSMISSDFSMQRKVLHDKLKITATEPEEILNQLRDIDAKIIIDTISANYYTTMFVATVDGTVLPKHTNELLKEGNFAPVPYIVGINNTEGFGVLALQMPPNFSEGMDKQTCLNVIKASLAMAIPPAKVEAVVEAILKTVEKEYEDEDQFKWSKIAGSILNDSWFVGPSAVQAMAHSAAGLPTYFYYMTQQLKMHHDKEYSGKVKMKPAFCEADHSDDIHFTFGHPFVTFDFSHAGFKFSDDERQLSKLWMNSLCSFAKSGNPNSGDSNVLEWPQYNCEKKRHLVMKLPYEEGSDLLPSRCKLWLETVPAILMMT